MNAKVLLVLSLLPVSVLAQRTVASPPDSVNGFGFNRSVSGLPKFDSLLVEKLGEYYYQGRAGKVANNKESMRQEVAILKRDLTNYYVLWGSFRSDLLTLKTMDDTSRYKVPTQTVSLPARVSGSSTNPTAVAFAYSADSSLKVLATPGQLELKQTASDSRIGQPVNIANAVFCFSAKQEVYAANQVQATNLTRIDALGKPTPIPLPAIFAKRHYRIDQILADDSLLLTRQIKNGKTYIDIWNFLKPKPAQVFSDSLPNLVNTCKLTRISSTHYLFSTYRVSDQTYALFLTVPDFSGKLIPVWEKPVKEYQLDPVNKKLVLLTADGSLVSIDTENPTVVNLITEKARYFAIQGNYVVYWQQRGNTSQWALQINNLSDGGSVPMSRQFWYDTDLRRDVPRLTFKGNQVRFDDYSNNTANYVSLIRQPVP